MGLTQFSAIHDDCGAMTTLSSQRASVIDRPYLHQYVGQLQASLFIYRRISAAKFVSQLVNPSTLRTASPPSTSAQHEHARHPRPFPLRPELYPPTQPSHQQASYLATYHPAVDNINLRTRLRGAPTESVSTRIRRDTTKRYPRGRAAKRASRPAS